MSKQLRKTNKPNYSMDMGHEQKFTKNKIQMANNRIKCQSTLVIKD